MKNFKTAGIIFLIILIVAYKQINAQSQQQIFWPSLMNSPWPMSKHDPQGTGRSDFPGPKNPSIEWTKDMEYGIMSGPVIDSNEFLYFGTSTSLIFSDTLNYFYSLNNKGELLWTFYTFNGDPNSSGLLISADSTIYFCSLEYLYAIDLTGNLKWTYKTNSLQIHQWLTNIGREGNIYSVNFDGYLNCINNSGSLNWQKKYDSGFWTNSPVFSPDGETIYIAGTDSNLYALNLDGSLKWKFISDKASAIPAVDNQGNIYFVSKLDSTGLFSLNQDGTLRWSYNFANLNFSGPVFLSPTIDKEGNIIFPAPQPQKSKIISVDYYGNFNWEYVFEADDEAIFSPLICDSEGTIYCGSTWGYNFYAISNHGNLLWKLPLDGYQVDNSGAIGSDGTLYIGTHLGSLVTGQKRTLIAIRDTVTSVSGNEEMIKSFKLEQNYPNPFNASTVIKYSIPNGSPVVVKLIIYDILGNEIATLVDKQQSAGHYEVRFNPADISSGIYFYKLTAGNYTGIKKLMLLK